MRKNEKLAKILRWYETLPCCEALLIKINNKIKYNVTISSFPINVT